MNRKSPARNDGIDLLRIVAMLMIVTTHVLDNGGIMQNVSSRPLNSAVVSLIETFSLAGLDAFAMLSGYVGAGRRHRCAGLAVLWLRVVWYTLIMTAVFQFAMPEIVGSNQWIQALLPVTTNQYWYFSSYTVMILLLPLVLPGLDALSGKRIIAVFASVYVLFFIATMQGTGDIFGFKGSYSPLWLLMMYVIGAAMKKTGACEKGCLWYGIGYIVLSAIDWALLKLIGEHMTAGDFLYNLNQCALVTGNIAPITIGASICLLGFFSQLKVGTAVHRILSAAAPLSFSVYIIHANRLLVQTIWPGVFAMYSQMSPLKLAVSVLATSLGIYAVCSLIDIPREMIFRKLDIKGKLSALEERFLP